MPTGCQSLDLEQPGSDCAGLGQTRPTPMGLEHKSLCLRGTTIPAPDQPTSVEERVTQPTGIALGNTESGFEMPRIKEPGVEGPGRQELRNQSPSETLWAVTEQEMKEAQRWRKRALRLLSNPSSVAEQSTTLSTFTIRDHENERDGGSKAGDGPDCVRVATRAGTSQPEGLENEPGFVEFTPPVDRRHWGCRMLMKGILTGEPANADLKVMGGSKMARKARWNASVAVDCWNEV